MSETKKTISCDQVAWLLEVIERYIPKDKHPRVSQQWNMKCFAMLYEFMDVAGLQFEDEKALNNAIPNFVNAWKNHMEEFKDN